MSQSTFKILFYLRKNRLNKNGQATIMVRVTLSGEISQFSSKLEIEPHLWDTKAGKAAGKSSIATKINSLLENIKNSLTNHYREIEARDSSVTVEKIRNSFLGFETRQQTLLELFKKHNQEAEKLIGISKTKATLQKLLLSDKTRISLKSIARPLKISRRVSFLDFQAPIRGSPPNHVK